MKKHRSSLEGAGGGGVVDEVFWSCNKWTSGGLPLFMQQHQRVRHPVSAASSASHMSSVSSSQRMRCAQCWMLDCTIPAVSTGEAVIRSRLEEPPCSLWRGRGHCSALWRSLLHSSPFCRVSPSFSLICSLPARWGWSAAHTPPGSSHRIVHPPTKPQLSRHDTADLFTLFFPPHKCLYRWNLLHAPQSGDVPEHVHIRDGAGFTWEYAALTLSERSPHHALRLGLHRL